MLGIVGAFAGAAIAGPAGAAKGFQIGFAVGSFVGAAVDASLTTYQTPDMGKMSDLKVTVASYGTSIPQNYGRTREAGTIVWGIDLQEHEEDIESGGGSGQPTVTTAVYTYTFSAALVLGKGNILNKVDKIYANDLVIFDRSSSGNTITPILDGSMVQVGESIVPANYPTTTLRVYSGTETQLADPLVITLASNTDIPAGADNPAFRGTFYMVVQDLPVTDLGNSVPNISVKSSQGTRYLSDVFEEITEQVNINTGTQLDTSLVTTIEFTGISVTSRVDAKSALQPILDAYHVDLIDIDGQVKAVPRGLASIAHIPWNDMGAVIVNSGTVPPSQRIVSSRNDDLALLKKVDVGYFSPTIDLQQSTQIAIKQSAIMDNKANIQYPLSLTDDEAKRLAECLLYLSWTERDQYKTSLMPEWINLCVADVVTVDLNPEGTLIEEVRISEMEVGTPGEIKVSLIKNDSTVYNRSETGATPTGGLPISASVHTVFFAWSGTELFDGESLNAGFYVAAYGAHKWTGASILMSVDGGTTYNPVGVVTRRSLFGQWDTPYPSLGNTYTPNGNGFDVEEGISVIMPNILVPTSTSEDDVLNGAGNFGLLLSSDTTVDNSSNYELMGFAEVSLYGIYSYAITDLLRGQRNTLATGHTNTDIFVQLTSAIVRIEVSSNLIGHTVLVKCVAGTIDPDTITPQEVYIAQNTSVAITGHTGVATIPDGVTVNPATYSGTTATYVFSPLWTSTSPPKSVIYQYQKTIDGGITWTGYDGTSGTYYTGATLPLGITSGTLQVRVRTKDVLEHTSSWVNSAIQTYSSPSVGSLWGQDLFTGDGVTTDFVLSATPSGGKTIVHYAGALANKLAGAGTDRYTIVTGSTIRFGTAPLNGRHIQVDYPI